MKKSIAQLEENTTWKTICYAIRNALFNEDIHISSSIKWKDVFFESKTQAISRIVHVGLKGCLPQDIESEWKQFDYSTTYFFVQILEEQRKIIDLLSGNGIPLVIIKGTAAAIYYPSPELRTMGDIDFLVPPKCFESVKKLFSQNQYKQDEKEDDRHIKFTKDSVLVEMHHRFSDKDDYVNVDSYITRCMNRLETGTIRGFSFPMLPSLENGIVLLAHLRQHLLVGVGLKQVLDWMMYAHAVLKDDYWKSVFRPELEKIGLEQLAIVVTRMCQIYLGLPEDITWCSEADETLCARLMNNIMQTGNFGSKHGIGTDIEKTFVNFRRNGLLKYLQRAGEFNWEAYHKHSWLKPFAWLYQIFRYLRQGKVTHRANNHLLDDYYRSKERYKLLKDLDCI